MPGVAVVGGIGGQSRYRSGKVFHCSYVDVQYLKMRGNTNGILYRVNECRPRKLSAPFFLKHVSYSFMDNADISVGVRAFCDVCQPGATVQ